MKYEINKAYSFPVKGYHYDDENRLFFDLIIQEESFPVLGYDIQLHSGCPDSLTCRLLYDANREVYIKQDENSIFPLLYKEDRRYIFEVTQLLPDNSCAVTDKYGISHIYQKPDNIELVTNEIFVSYVRINKCKDDTINLEFCQENANNLSLTNKDEDTIIENIIDNNNSDVFPIEIVPFIDTREVTNREVSLFEDKAAKPIGEKDFLDNNNKTKKNSQAEIAISEKEKIQDFAYIINLDNEETLYEYLRNNMKGTNVKLIQTEIIKYIESGMQGHNYWELVLKLSRFNAHLVVATINAANKNKIDDIKDIDSNYVTPIVNALMTATDKLYHAISILMPIKNSLKSDDINILLTKSSGANTPLVFHDMFKLTELDSDAAVSYLRSNSSNIAASFALYEFFISAKNRGMIRANTPIKMFKPSQIRSIIALMKNENTFNKLLAPIMENALFNTNNQIGRAHV